MSLLRAVFLYDNIRIIDICHYCAEAKMDSIPFIGRQKELEKLNDLLDKKTASLVVIKGRRRVGKSRLIEEFGKHKPFYRFSGLTPIEGITAQHQRNEFARILNLQFGLPELQVDDWSKLFMLLADKVKKGRYIIVFDEITWMAHDDVTFLVKLQNAWESYFNKNSKLILILCGSVSAWIEKNIMSSTGYFGRISKLISLEEFSLPYCKSMLEAVGFKRSAFEKFIVLSLTGGIPWYIEHINGYHSAAENMRSLCFEADGLLVKEYKYIFHDLFGKRSAIYEKITRFLSGGAAEYLEIAKGIDYSSSGTLSEYLSELLESGYISNSFTWSLKSGKETSICQYRLTDNYLRFYYKYIEPQLPKILKGQYQAISLSSMPSWETVIGLQFENLVLKNRHLIQKALKIHPDEIITDNPYFQRKTARYPGCQIDYLIQTRLKTLFICEIKFSKNTLGKSIIGDMQKKISSLAVAKNFACIPVLIHVNGVSEELMESDYFYQIINFTEFLEDL